MKKTDTSTLKGASPVKLIDAKIKELGDWRAIDFHEGDRVDMAAFKALIREAVVLNTR